MSELPTSSDREPVFDTLLAGAIKRMCRDVAEQAAVVGPRSIGEIKYMKPALRTALTGIVGEALHPKECRETFKHWQGPAQVRLGGIDLAVRRTDGSGWRAFIELKWGDIDWAILDLLKMTTGRFSPGADACYVIASEPTRVWTSDNPVAALFQTARWDSKTVLERCRRQFVGDGREHGKLTALPPQIETVLVADEPVPAPLDGWRIKAVRVEPDPPNDDVWLTVSDGLIASA